MTRSEPAWWAEARRLRADGWKIIAIAAQLQRHPETIRYALDAQVRVRQNARCLRRIANMTPAQRLHLNAMDRASHRRRREKILDERKKALDTSGGGGKLAPDGAHQAPLNSPPET